MLSTSFTRLVGCVAPLQSAPLPLIGAPDLVVAVADAGALAMLGAPLATPEELEALIDAIAGRTRGVFGVSFLMPFLDRACVELATRKAPVVDFFYGDPEPDLVALAHRSGARVGWQVGSADEAVAAQKAGRDFIVAQGVEAGGHVRGRISLLPLLGRVLKSVSCPVVAAGGIGRPADLAAVLTAGAAGARLGTRFLAAREAATHPRYLELLLKASAEDTVYTQAFSVMWPNAPHRVLRSCVEAAESCKEETVGEVALPAGPMAVPRLSAIAPSRDTTGRIEAMALYAGESVDAVTRVEPAADIVRDLVEGASRILARDRSG